jgi:Spy/CpxP family protein refolding chaperone
MLVMNKNVIVLFAFIGIFLCGAITGGFLSVRYTRGLVQKKAAEQMTVTQWHKISDHIDLTDAQRAKITPIIQQYTKEQQVLRKSTQALSEKFNAGIEAVLTDAQREEFVRRREEMREIERRWQRWIKDQRSEHGSRPPKSKPKDGPRK